MQAQYFAFNNQTKLHLLYPNQALFQIIQAISNQTTLNNSKDIFATLQTVDSTSR